VKPNQRLVKSLKDQIKKLTKASLVTSELKDEYTTELAKLAEKKRRHTENVVTPKAEARQGAPGAEVVDLLEILKKSLSEEVKEEPRGQAPSARSRTRSAAGPKSERRPRAQRTARTKPEQKSKDDLYERAKSLGIEGRSKMNKRQLATAVRQAS
jgi:hypothetical protein